MSDEPARKTDYEPACLNATDLNLVDGKYCFFCEMIWYNCLCCHED